jgi:hypothetical protein
MDEDCQDFHLVNPSITFRSRVVFPIVKVSAETLGFGVLIDTFSNGDIQAAHSASWQTRSAIAAGSARFSKQDLANIGDIFFFNLPSACNRVG